MKNYIPAGLFYRIENAERMGKVAPPAKDPTRAATNRLTCHITVPRAFIRDDSRVNSTDII
jgi:hypothetical protein